jgi:hypothetical protein
VLYLADRLSRRLKENLAILLLWVRGIPQQVRFYIITREHRERLSYIWNAFSYLALLDMKEAMVAEDGRFAVFGSGRYVELEEFSDSLRQERLRKVCISQYGRTLVIHEWRPDTREVSMEMNSKHRTNWFEVLRTGQMVDGEGLKRAEQLLRVFYGDGPDDKADSRADIR